ncbi:MAG: glycoside hydrolase family 9 protein [Candidatus Marinimicrobia bacterium]|nr:glycoside hydrolase family 9 protein [Candidatus Neomarinimicrobiota bacterium]
MRLNGLGRRWQVAWVMALGVGVAGCAWGAETLPLAEALVPLAGEWRHEAGVWRAVGEEPPAGWYLRGLRQYRLEQLDFEVLKEQAGGLIYLYTGDWRILLRDEGLSVKYAGTLGPGKPVNRQWLFYQWSALRPLNFPAATWSAFRLRLDGEAVRLYQDGREVLAWSSPRAEWEPRMRASGKLAAFMDWYEFPDRLPEAAVSGQDQIVVFQALHTRAALRNIRLSGEDTGAAVGFHPDAPGEPDAGEFEGVAVRPDWRIERLAPAQPVAVTWELPPAQRNKAAALPPVSSWAVESDALYDPPDDSPREVEVLIGQDGVRAPNALYHHARTKRTQIVRYYFNLASEGLYTLQAEWGIWGMGWGPNVLKMSVNGQPVSREVYRAFAQNRACPAGSDYVPLRLAAGPHRVDVEMDLAHITRTNFRMKYLRLPFRAVRLVPGLDEPLVVLQAGRAQGPEQTLEALAAPISVGEAYGKILRYRIVGLEPQAPYQVTLGFHEMDINRAGLRRMEIAINGQVVEPELDVFAAAGWAEDLRRTYTATTQTFPDGETGIEVRLHGLNFKAFLNHLSVTDAQGQTVLAQNCGWSQLQQNRIQRRIEHEVSAPVFTNTIPAATESGPESVFDGHNLIANPQFALVDDARGRPQYWFDGPELADLISLGWQTNQVADFSPELAARLLRDREQPNFMRFFGLLPGRGEFAHDAAVGRGAPGALRIGKVTEPEFAVIGNQFFVDAGKPQAFRFHARADGASGRIWAEIHWFAMNMDADMKFYDGSTSLHAPRLQWLGVTRGAALAADQAAGWTELTARAMPPDGALYALPAIRVADNAQGSFLVDDAEFNGYGDLPLEITQSHLGYHPLSDKRLIVRSQTEAPVQWTLKDDQGQMVRSGSAEAVGHEPFSGRYYYRLDLTDFTREGRYQLEAQQAGRSVQGPMFRIERGVYRELSRKMLHGLWFKRMNADVPGGHEPDCLEDAYTPNTQRPDRFCMYENLRFPGRLDLLGGYYDAGDMIKHVEFWPAVALALWQMTETLPPFEDRGAHDALDELDWLLAAWHKFVLPDGTVVLSTKPQGYTTDNIPYYVVDRTMDQNGTVKQAPGLLALAAWNLRERNPALSQIYLKAALRTYDRTPFWQTLAQIAAPEQVGPTETSLAAKALLAETYLYRLTGETVYRERRDRHAALLAAGLRQRAYAPLSEMFRANDNQGAALQDCVWVPVHVLRLEPELPARADLEAGLRAFAEHVRELAEPTVWGQALAMNTPADQPPQRWPANSENRSGGYWPTLAFTLAETGMLLEDAEIVRLAERQLQWCLGLNMADVAMVQGVGTRVVAGGDHMFCHAEFFDAWLRSDRRQMDFDGNVPTKAFRDVGTGEINVRRGDNWSAPVEGYPVGYTPLPLQPNYGFHPQPSENYLPQTAQYALAAAGLEAAMDWLEAQSAKGAAK